jgi:large subunit ribosomal protein L23
MLVKFEDGTHFYYLAPQKINVGDVVENGSAKEIKVGNCMPLRDILKMDKIHLYDKILSPMVTEKTTNLSEQNKIVFKVPRAANKTNLKKNIEKIFKVNVTKINIVNKQNRTVVKRGKKVNVQGYKKAIITLKKGQSIDLTTGI